MLHRVGDGPTRPWQEVGVRNSARQRASVFDGTLDPSAGFTLLEIVIVATILTLGACGLVSVVVNAMTVNTSNQETTEGVHAGMQLLERIRQRWDEVGYAGGYRAWIEEQ